MAQNPGGERGMTQEFRFSLFMSSEELLKAVHYIADRSSVMCAKIIGHVLPISSLTVFSHYPDEFEYWEKMLPLMGAVLTYNNGPYVNLTEPILLPTGKIMKLRVRYPDPERPQVGCNDFEVKDYTSFKKHYLDTNPNNLRLIMRPEYEMIEFFDKDFDVLAYVLSKQIV